MACSPIQGFHLVNGCKVRRSGSFAAVRPRLRHIPHPPVLAVQLLDQLAIPAHRRNVEQEHQGIAGGKSLPDKSTVFEERIEHGIRFSPSCESG